MKNKIVSTTDWLVIKIATFFGLAIILNIRQARIAFTGAQHRHIGGLIGWWRSRFHIQKFTPMWERVHYRWVELATTEGEAKDTFFSVRNGHRPEDTVQLLDNATQKWVSFFRSQSNEYYLEMLRKLVVHWTPEGSSANKKARTVLEWFIDFRVVTATSRSELQRAAYYAEDMEDSFQLQKITERLAEMQRLAEKNWAEYVH